MYPVVVAMIVTMFWRPTVANEDHMSPAVEDGQVIIISKEKYSENRGYPDLGQVVAFSDDIATAAAIEGENSIRRVVGLPGDKMEIKSGNLYRNEKKMNEPYAKGSMEDMKPVHVGKEEVFVLADNRENSVDSRDPKVGTIEMRLIRGKCSLIVWPLSDFGGVK